MGFEKYGKVKFIANYVGVCFLAFALPVPPAGLCSHASPPCYTASPRQSLGCWSGAAHLRSGLPAPSPSTVPPPSPSALCVFSLYPCHLECMYFFFFLLDQKVSLGTAAPVCGICGDIPLVLEGLLSQGKHSLSLPCDEYRNEWRKERSFLHLKVLLESKRK